MRLKELRKAEKLTRNELADIVGLKPRTISAYENSEREPNIQMLINFADLFDVSIDYLVERND